MKIVNKDAIIDDLRQWANELEEKNFPPYKTILLLRNAATFLIDQEEKIKFLEENLSRVQTHLKYTTQSPRVTRQSVLREVAEWLSQQTDVPPRVTDFIYGQSTAPAAPAKPEQSPNEIERGRCDYDFHKTRCRVCGRCPCWKHDHFYDPVLASEWKPLPSPEAFEYLEKLREAYISHINDLEAKNKKLKNRIMELEKNE